MAQNAWYSTSFDLYGVKTVLKEVENPDLPVWNVVVGGPYEQPWPLMGDYYLSAIDGSIVEYNLEPDPEYRAENP